MDSIPCENRMIEALNANPKIDVVYAHNDPMAVGAYLAAKEKDREKEMIFIGIDGLNGPSGGIKQVIDGVLETTFVYPLCVDKAVEIGNHAARSQLQAGQNLYNGIENRYPRHRSSDVSQVKRRGQETQVILRGEWLNATLAKYRERIRSGEINPMVRWDRPARAGPFSTRIAKTCR